MKQPKTKFIFSGSPLPNFSKVRNMGQREFKRIMNIFLDTRRRNIILNTRRCGRYITLKDLVDRPKNKRPIIIDEYDHPTHIK